MDWDPTLEWRTIVDDGFNSLIGPLYFASSGDRAALTRLTLEQKHINIGGVCHGGVLLSVADVAMGWMARRLAKDAPVATIDLDGHFLAGAKLGQTLLAEASCNRRVRDLAFMTCRIRAGGRDVFAASGIWKTLSVGG